MIRTTDAEVAAICEVDLAIPLTPFIAVASALVDQIEQLSDSPDAARLLLIETWLAAHFYCQRDVRPSAERAGPVSQTLESVIALRLDNTRYGQMALCLDPTGFLASLGKVKKRIGVYWLGKPQSQIRSELGDV